MFMWTLFKMGEKIWQKLGMQILYNSLAEIVAGLLYAHLHALFGVD
jgi:hypothetical protein